MVDSFFDLDNNPSTFAVNSDFPSGLPIRGLDGSDRISGSESPEVIFGNTGADYLYAGSGADSLHGGRGSDVLFGNQGTDPIEGERGNDILFGGRDNDVLLGGVGDDFLAGDAGTDILTGGEGSDAFVLDIRHGTSDPALADVITDFSNDDGDVLALTDGVNDALTEADLTLETTGSDTFISLTATGAILGRVQGVTLEELTGSFTTVKATLDDTESGATNLGLMPGQVSIQGEVSDEDYFDFFQFQVPETNIVNFSLTGLSADADLTLYQDLDGDGELGEDEIISSSERSDTANETIENVTLKRGQYFLGVEQYEGNTSYTLSLAGVAGSVAPDLAGSEPSTARLLPPDAEVELHDYVGETDPMDTYRLEVLNSGYLDLFTTYQDANLNLTLWSDRNGNNQLDADETIAQGTDEIQQDIIDPGTYYVNVTAPGAATSYEILAIASPGSRVGIESYDPLLPGLPTSGTLSQTDAEDPNDPDNYADPYLLSELGAGLTVTVTQESKDFDAYLRVVDLFTGEVVAENDDKDTAGENFDAQVSFTTEQGGQYLVYASSVDAPGVGDYTLNTTVTGTETVVSSVSSASPQSEVQSNGASDSSSGSSAVSNSSSDSQEPPPKFMVKVQKPDGTEIEVLRDLVYKPLEGGDMTSKPIIAMHQNGFGHCYFLAALTATFGKIENASAAQFATSKVLNDAVKSNGTNYTITFYDKGTKQEVTVDNQVITNREENILYGTGWKNEKIKPTEASMQPIWPSIFERAFAKRQGGYDRISSGAPPYALALITGQDIEYIPLKIEKTSVGSDKEQTQEVYPRLQVKTFTSQSSFSGDPLKSIPTNELFQTIQTALNNGRYVATGTKDGKFLYKGVLEDSHAYSVHNAYVDAENNQMILLRNPWGVDNGTDAKAEEDPSENRKDGFVAITFEAFLENFDNVSISNPQSP